MGASRSEREQRLCESALPSLVRSGGAVLLLKERAWILERTRERENFGEGAFRPCECEKKKEEEKNESRRRALRTILFSSLFFRQQTLSKGKKTPHPLLLVSPSSPPPVSFVAMGAAMSVVRRPCCCEALLDKRTRELKKKRKLFCSLLDRLVIELAFVSFSFANSPSLLSAHISSLPNRSSRALQVAVAGPVFAGASIGMSIAGDVKVRFFCFDRFSNRRRFSTSTSKKNSKKKNPKKNPRKKRNKKNRQARVLGEQHRGRPLDQPQQALRLRAPGHGRPLALRRRVPQRL